MRVRAGGAQRVCVRVCVTGRERKWVDADVKTVTKGAFVNLELHTFFRPPSSVCTRPPRLVTISEGGSD